MTSFRPARLLGALALCSSLFPSLAEARPPIDPDNQPEDVIGCLANVRGSLSAEPSSIRFGQSTTLHYQTTVPSNCTGVRLFLNGETLSARAGDRTVTPNADVTYTLRARRGVAEVPLASASVQVVLGQRVTITQNDQVQTFLNALATPGTDVYLADDVDLDLSGLVNIPVEAGVSVFGGRTARVPGARLRTTTRPNPLFWIVGDGVRISGVRIEGADMDIVGTDDPMSCGISTDSLVDIEIDHSEISGFSGSAVRVTDSQGRIDLFVDPDAIHVHDNFIHHNRHAGTHGYGVVVGDGAYVLIEQNVFDYNRHAIAGDGSDDSGYRLYRNLVLENGGEHRFIPLPPMWLHTHQVDMHGQDNCGIEGLSDAAFNCGTAGHDMDIRNNTFLYARHTVIKLRGSTQVQPFGMAVIDNVFAHDDIDDAAKQEESGLYVSGNQTGVNGMNELSSCDFDADGVADSFLATGQTWWFSSGGSGPWTYLNASKKRRSEVELGFFDADNRCDVRADGVLYPGGQPLSVSDSIGKLPGRPSGVAP